MGERSLRVGNRTIELGNADKVLFPDAGLTKADLVDYYRAVAEWMLPHLEGRPLTLQRFPDGIGEEGFYQKEASDYFPDWIERTEMEKEGGTVHHVVATEPATLAYLASQACVTLHVWQSRADKPSRPDRLVFDLDPPDKAGDEVELGPLRSTARELRALLDDELGLRSLLMTTGSRGFHVVVPIVRRYDFDDARAFARAVAEVLVARRPDRLTVEQRKAKRGDRIFVDVLRNGYAQTAVAPYSVRARPGAPVALPLAWEELDDADPRRHRLPDVPALLAERGDAWGEAVAENQALGDAREAVARLNEALRK